MFHPTGDLIANLIKVHHSA